jgi:hypothetical protein
LVSSCVSKRRLLIVILPEMLVYYPFYWSTRRLSLTNSQNVWIYSFFHIPHILRYLSMKSYYSLFWKVGRRCMCIIAAFYSKQL